MLEEGFRDVKVMGTQNYTFENAANWIRAGKPELKVQQHYPPKGLEWLEEYYDSYLEERRVSDALLAVGYP